MNVLVTGGTGYIGSHTCVELIRAGHKVIIIDNLTNSQKEVANSIEKITGTPVNLYIGDILDESILDRIFSENQIDAVIHFAALKSVPASMAKPLTYYHNNVTGTLTLCRAMENNGCKTIIFSSSATVYGIAEKMPIQETAPISPINVYGRTKVMMESVMTDLTNADSGWNVTLLRYFNPIGAHESGLIGEVPSGIPSNLMPYITQVAAGVRPHLNVTGTDFDTPDGTGVRDYIHVTDLAAGHIRALEAGNNGLSIYNLGTGRGYSVLEVISSFEQSTGVKIPYITAPRRPGDPAVCYADPSKAERELNWTARRSMEDMCKSSWNFARQYYEAKK